MHVDAFDRYHEAVSPLHRLDPRVKAVVTVAYILSNALMPDGAWIAFAFAWFFHVLVPCIDQSIYDKYNLRQYQDVLLHGYSLLHGKGNASYHSPKSSGLGTTPTKFDRQRETCELMAAGFKRLIEIEFIDSLFADRL